MDGELHIFDFLLEGFLVEDDLVSVDEVLFEFVRKDSFDRVDFVGLGDLFYE